MKTLAVWQNFSRNFFDCMVVDAPCSGEGMFRKDEQARNEWSEANVRLCAERQQEILDNAAKMLKPGGRMVYSTCTFAPEEDEDGIAAFLERHPEFSVVCLEKDEVPEGLSSGHPSGAVATIRSFRIPSVSGLTSQRARAIIWRCFARMERGQQKMAEAETAEILE